MKIILPTLLIASFLYCSSGFTAQAQNKIQAADTAYKYRVVISFFSFASGIDRAAKKSIDSLIDEYSIKRNITLEREETRWGREGEIDYCMKLKELTTKEQKKLIKRMDVVAVRSKRVNILQNRNCLHRH